MNEVHGLQLDDKALLDEDINESSPHVDFLVLHRDLSLALESDTIQAELNAERRFVDLFKQPWTENSVNLKGSGDYPTRQRVEVGTEFSSLTRIHLPRSVTDFASFAQSAALAF